jgi:8-amino-7-oxononanoate synthase
VSWSRWLEREHERREHAALTRRLRPTESPAEPVARRDGRELVNLCSSNYLGLAGDPRLVEAAARGAVRGGGAGSSRLMAGHDPAFAELEEKVAAFKGTERALVLGSGYLANVGILTAVLDRDAAVFADRLNHASLIDGVRLSGARSHRYRHLDLEHLERLLQASDAPRKLIVTDTVFSMDGDVAPLRELVSLKERYGAALLVDEAHAGGVLGPHGEGLAHELGIAGEVELQMGTFSKAYGAYGAYVAASGAWIDHLVSACRTLVYSTALPPAVVATIDAAVDLVRDADDRRAALRAKAERFRAGVRAAGFDTGGSTTQIVPALVGESERALALAAALEEHGVLAVGIRPPTVPAGTARLRFSLLATHTDEQLDLALQALADAGA